MTFEYAGRPFTPLPNSTFFEKRVADRMLVWELSLLARAVTYRSIRGVEVRRPSGKVFRTPEL